MAITSFEEKISTRLATLESRFEALIVQDRPGSKAFGVGRVPFGGATGVLTDDANLIWDNINKRLGVGGTPTVKLHIQDTSAAAIDVQSSATAGFARIRFATNTRTFGFVTEGSTGATFPGQFSLFDFTASQSRITVDATGNISIPATNLGIGEPANAVTRLHIKGASATSADYALILANSSGTAMFIARNDNRLGFFGSGEIARPTVTGSRGGNAALASALTALHSLGLIIDSSTP